MLSSIARSVRLVTQQHQRFVPKVASNVQQQGLKKMAPIVVGRYFSTSDPQTFQPQMPDAITADVAEAIQDTTLFYLRHGISNQRLIALSKDTETPLVMKWQRMMEIYLSTQVYVISGLGFSGDEQGLQAYTHKLADFIQNKCDDDERDMFKQVGAETWKELLATAFHLDTENLKEVSIVDARNIMHKVSSKMQEPNILMKIQKECGKIPDSKFICMYLFDLKELLWMGEKKAARTLPHHFSFSNSQI